MTRDINLWEPFSNQHMIQNRPIKQMFQKFKKLICEKLDYQYADATIKSYLYGYESVKRNEAYYIMRDEAYQFQKKYRLR